MKITLLEPIGISSTLLEELSAPIRAQGHTFVSFDTKTTDPAEQQARIGDSDAVIIANTPLPASVIASAPKLQLLDVAFTGIDHVGLDACKEKGITVCNAAGYSNSAVAELALGLTSGCLRYFNESDRACRSGGVGIRGTEIAGRTVGIVGTGAIGLYTARLFAAFGAKVIAYSRSIRQEALDLGIEYVSLEELLQRSDIVSLHVPSNAQTRHLIGADQLALMQKHAVLINCARGAVVDNAALAAALERGDLAAAGIDVFDTEPPLPESDPLTKAPRTLLTPHVAYNTVESMERRARIVFRNLEAWLAGNPENVCSL